MPLTRDFKETIRARVVGDPKFRKELLREAIKSIIAGDTETAKTILRNYINTWDAWLCDQPPCDQQRRQ